MCYFLNISTTTYTMTMTVSIEQKVLEQLTCEQD